MAQETLELKQASNDTAERRAKSKMGTIKLHCMRGGRGVQTTNSSNSGHHTSVCYCHVTSHKPLQELEDRSVTIAGRSSKENCS